MGKLLLLSSCIITLLIYPVGCSVGLKPAVVGKDEDPHKLIIAVVGDGVPSKRSTPSRQYPLNRAQGRAMWEGAEAAFSQSPHLEQAREVFQLRPYDDGSLESEAEKIGVEIQSDPRVMVVIGHASSGTTRKAAWLYAQAGIPLLMPVATSPYAVYPPGARVDDSTRLRACFRLSPSDDKVQAPAVAFVAEEMLKVKRGYLVQDISEGASEYSKPLYDRLEQLLGNVLIDKQKLDRGKADFSGVASNIEAQNPDIVIFCGYGSTATLVLSALRHAYKDKPSSKPKIILTDGSRVKDLNTSGFDVYMTFPLPDITYFKDCRSQDYDILLKTIMSHDEQSFQIYGYDAMLMVGKALEKCTAERISRDCLRKSLSELPFFTGSTCLQYFFAEGDNTLSEYYVFRSNSDYGAESPSPAISPPTAQSKPTATPTPLAEQAVPKFALERKISSQELERYRKGG